MLTPHAHGRAPAPDDAGPWTADELAADLDLIHAPRLDAPRLGAPAREDRATRSEWVAGLSLEPRRPSWADPSPRAQAARQAARQSARQAAGRVPRPRDWRQSGMPPARPGRAWRWPDVLVAVVLGVGMAAALLETLDPSAPPPYPSATAQEPASVKRAPHPYPAPSAVPDLFHAVP